MRAQNYSPERLREIFERHDPAEIAALKRHIDSLAWGPEALRLGRALARYEDQRGWRDRARRRYKAMLEKSQGNRFAMAALHLDQAEMALRWDESPQYDLALAVNMGLGSEQADALDDDELRAR